MVSEGFSGVRELHRGVPFRWLTALLPTLLLAACATPSTPRKPAVPVPLGPHLAVAPVDDLPMHLLQAEFAMQAGDLATAADAYAEAVRLTDDAAVAEQAARVAVAARHWPQARVALARWEALQPKAPERLQVRAWIELGSGDAERAYADLAALLAEGGQDGWRLVAQSLLGVEDRAAAARLLERLATPERLGRTELPWVATSQLAYKLGERALAGRLAAAAVERFHSADAYAWQARLALDGGDKDAARAIYAEALRRDPRSVRLRTGYAALLADGGDDAGAARALAGGEQDDVTYGARAAYAARAEDKPQLNALYREIEADHGPRSGRRLFVLGQLAELTDRPAKALDWYREVPIDDDHWYDAQVRGVVVQDRLGQRTEALDALHVLQGRADDDAGRSVDLTLLEADLLARAQRRPEALAAYARGLETVPEDLRLLYARALLEAELGRIAEAEQDLRRVLVHKPDHADALNALGYTLADRTDRHDEALALIEKALALKPDEPAILDSHGWALFKLGRLDEAERELRRAFERQPDAEIAAHLGEVLWARGERDAARKIWAQGAAKDADNATLRDTMRRLGA